MPDASFHPGSNDQGPNLEGIPYVFLMRNILQEASDWEYAADMMRDARRTINLIVGLGDGKEKFEF